MNGLVHSGSKALTTLLDVVVMHTKLPYSHNEPDDSLMENALTLVK